MLFRYSSRLLTLTRLVTRWQLHRRETEGGSKRRTRWRWQWHWGVKSERREDEEGWKKEKEELDKEGAREERRQQRKGLEERIKGREGGVNEGQFVGEGWRRRRYRIYWIKMLATKPNSHLRMILSVLHVSLQDQGTGGKTQAPIYTWDGSAMFVAMCFPRSLKAQWLRRSDFQCHCADDGSVGDDGGTRVVLSGLRLAEELASSLSSPVLLQKNGRWYPLRSYFYPSAREAVSFDWTYNTTCSTFIDPEMGRDKDREAQSLFWSL